MQNLEETQDSSTGVLSWTYDILVINLGNKCDLFVNKLECHIEYLFQKSYKFAQQ